MMIIMRYLGFPLRRNAPLSTWPGLSALMGHESHGRGKNVGHHSRPSAWHARTTVKPASRRLAIRLALSFLAMSLTAVLASVDARADRTSPTGLWKNMDDVSGKPRALIRITESGGMLLGRIEKVFPGPQEDPNPRCTKCEGTNKDAPVVGLEILSGLSREGGEYVGGQILDPDNGKVYRSKLRLSDNGRKLDVRGYIGVPMLGRSQTWLRQE